jgi:hypothetical protein
VLRRLPDDASITLARRGSVWDSGRTNRFRAHEIGQYLRPLVLLLDRQAVFIKRTYQEQIFATIIGEVRLTADA